MRGHAVIGAGYGDEGKGVLVNVLAQDAARDGFVPFVVRSNGGGQAAHTVELNCGLRYVFKHHGSGTFAGAPTYLSQDFIVNPIIFFKEHRKLQGICESLGKKMPKVYCSPDALVSLPIDMMINQELEKSRGDERHGSCGWGIGETVQRTEAGYAVRVRDLSYFTVEKLQELNLLYGIKRFKELGIDPPDDLFDNRVNKRFIKDIEFFMHEVDPLTDDSLELLGDYVIFEGAQGLGLDQDKGHFPYVTRSNTGLKNIRKLAELNNITDLVVLYATRCYNTRHGAGPLEWEGELKGVFVNDPTNVENPWQQKLRTAPIDLDVLSKRINDDFGDAPYVKSLAITCMDQIHEEFVVAYDGETHIAKKREVHILFPARVEVDRYLVCGSPTGHNTIQLTRIHAPTNEDKSKVSDPIS